MHRSKVVAWSFVAVTALWTSGCGPLDGDVETDPTAEVESDLTSPAPCTSTSDEACEGTLTFAAGKMPYFRTYPLGQRNEAVTQAVIAVHGISRNHAGQFSAIVRAARSRNALDQTLVLAPKYLTSEDSVPSGFLFWSDSGWKEGDTSAGPGVVSSFELMDSIVRSVLDTARFPNLKRLTIIGHSAGGQFAQRYAAGGRATSETVDIQYIVSNPSSYMYLNAQRADGKGGWVVPSTTCRYDRYRYGLDGRNAYMNALSADEIRTRFVGRDVVYFLGEADTLRDEDLDKSCAGDLQGRNRLERGRNYAAHVKRFFAATHPVVTVPNVGHTATGMYTSSQGQKLLFP
jgi:pimeloyl-ACP methyl ester carboxylesterase